MASFEDALNSAVAPVLADASVTGETVITLESEPKEEPKVEEEPKPEEPKPEEAPKEEPKVEEEPKPEEAPKEEPKVEEAPKPEEPKPEEPKPEEPKPEEPKEEPKPEEPKPEEPKPEEAPKEEPKPEEPKVEEPKPEEPKPEEPKEERPIDEILGELDLPENKLEAIKAIVEAKPAPTGKAITAPTPNTTGSEPETADGKSIAVTPVQEVPAEPAEPKKAELTPEELKETMDKFIEGAEKAFKDVAIKLGQDGKDAYRRALSNVKHDTFTPDDILILDKLSAEAASRK